MLTREEFSSAVKILYSQVFTRMIVQWSLTLMSEFFFQLGSLCVRSHVSPSFPVHGIEETERSSCSLSFPFTKTATKIVVPVVSQCIIECGTAMQRSVLWAYEFFLSCMPRWMDGAGGAAAIGRIPNGVWRAVPLTIITVAQTSIALPFALGRFEDFLVRATRGKPNKHESPLRCEDGGGKRS